MARRFTTQIGAIRQNRFARIGSQTNPYFLSVRANRPAMRNLILSAPKTRFAEKGVQFGNPTAIRANQVTVVS